MKNWILGFIVLLSSNFVYAGSKIVKMDIDDSSTTIVRVDLDLDFLYYYIDPNACLCWVSSYSGTAGAQTVSTFDCKALKTYKKLEKHLEKCIAPEAVAEAPKKEEATAPKSE